VCTDLKCIQSVFLMGVPFAVQAVLTLVPYSFKSLLNTILISEAVILLVRTAIVAIPIQIHTIANKRAITDLGMRSPYL
jgi:hypothetical protein